MGTTNEFERKNNGSGRAAELLAIKLLTDLKWNVTDVHDVKKYRHIGDLIIEKGKYNYNTDVKNDWQIGKWGNFFFEVSIDRRDTVGKCTGWYINASYDVLMFNNSKDNIMYILDYKTCQEKVDGLYHRMSGEVWNDHEKAYCIGKLVRVTDAIANDLVVAEIHYDKDKNITNYINYETANRILANDNGSDNMAVNVSYVPKFIQI